VARAIRPEKLVVANLGYVVVKLSEEPPQRWCEFFSGYLANPASMSGTYRKSVFQDWDRSVPGPIFKADVDDYKNNYHAVVLEAAKHANQQMQRYEDELASRAEAKSDAEQKHSQELEREREKASQVTFE
jgi:hypothetical protein